MHTRRALPAVVLAGSLALVGGVFALTTTSHAASAPMTKGSVANTRAPLAAATVPTPTTPPVSSLIEADGNHVSVAVENLDTGTTASYNVGDDYVTASIVKLDILCTLLYQGQLSGHAPSDSELSLVTPMIENSDNDAAQHLFEDEGGSSAITSANRVFGLTETTVEKDSVDEAGYSWGDTTTSVLDQIRLLQQVFTTSSVLTPANRSYVENLMKHVEPEQRWGISAASDDPSPSGSDYMLKNGWLQRSTNHLWEINSIGEVEHDGQEYLVAVLSSNNETMESGIGVVQQVAKAAVDDLG